MKKLAIILGIFIFCLETAFCAETQPKQDFTDNRATIAVQKQPTTEQNQKQVVKGNKWCIILMKNGKVKEDAK